VRCFRNTRGVVQDMRSGNWITYGLATGASDTILIVSRVVTPEMVGTRVGLFGAVEVKAPGARTEKQRLVEQTNFITMVREFGGLGGFATSVEEARRIILL
jgi:hypothetical protein